MERHDYEYEVEQDLPWTFAGETEKQLPGQYEDITQENPGDEEREAAAMPLMHELQIMEEKVCQENGMLKGRQIGSPACSGSVPTHAPLSSASF